MKKKLLFITFLMLFCSTMFGQDHYVPVNTGQYSTSTTFISVISFDGVEQAKELELGVFCNDEVRASVRTSYNPIKKRYIATASVKGQSGDVFKFKVYDHSANTEWSNDCTITYVDKNGITRVAQYVTFDSENGYGTSAQPCIINFNTPLHWTYNDSFENGMIVNSIVKIDNITQQNTNYELGVFCGGDVRGSAKLNSDGTVNTMVYGNAGDVFTFNLYDPNKGEGFDNNGELIFTEVNNITFNENGYFNLEVNFITAPYVAQIGTENYTSFEAALEAAVDGNEIILLENITLEVNPTVVSKDININLNSKTVSGTIKLAHIGATVTGVAEAMTVTSGVEGYIVVLENGVYSLSERQPSGQVAYRAYINDNQSREAVQVDLTNVYAKTSFVVELLDANDNVLTTTSLKAGGVDAESYTCNIVLWGTESGSWDTEIKALLTVANIPTTIKVYADGTLVNTYANALGAGTNVDETEKYKALDCVYKEAKIGETLYATFAAAYEAAATGNEIILLANVDFAETTVSKDININLNNNTVTGTIVLAHTGATVTCAEGAVTVTTNVAGYEVVYENGVYSLSEKQASAEVAYRAYVHDNESFEGLGVDLVNVYAKESLKVELYSGEQLLTSTTYAKDNYPIDAAAFTCLIVLDGTADEYWNTEIKASELTVANIPTTIKVYADNDDNWVHTYENALGAETNVDETAKYKALDCVLDTPVAKVGNTEYYNIDNAIANWTNNTTLTLLADVTLSDVITLKSTEHHILNLSTRTMTAAEGKNAIEITPEGAGTAAKQCLTINADVNNPGGITATAKSCIYYRKTNGVNDRLMVTINGGVFNGTYSINSSSNNGGQACPYYLINGGTFNGNVNLAKAMLKTTGGIFNGWINCTGDVTAYRLISGGTFKQWQFMTTGPSNNGDQKFTVGNTKNVFDCGVYVDDNGFLVVGGPVVTEAGETYEASTDNYGGWSSYLKYSSAKDNGLYYTSVEEALADNNKTSGSVNIYTDELDLTNLNYKGTLVITEHLTVTFPEGTTPAWTVASGEEDHEVGYTESVANGVVTRVYTSIIPVAKVGEKYYATLEDAIAAATSSNAIIVLKDIEASEVISINKTLTIKGDGHKITSSANRIFRVTESNINVTLEDVNMVSSAVVQYPNDIRGVSIDNETEKVKLTLTNCTVDFTDASASDWAYAVNVTGGNEHNVTVNGGTYEGANVINVRGNNHTININNAELTSLYKANDSYHGCCVRLEGSGSTLDITYTTFNGEHAVAVSEATAGANTVNAPLEEGNTANNTDNTKVYVAKNGDVYYHSVTEAIAEAQSGATIKLLAKNIDEYVNQECNKSITILGAAEWMEGKVTTLTGGMYLGIDNSQCNPNTIVVKGITFEGKGLKIASQENVTVENNIFNNITDDRAIAVIGKDIKAVAKNNTITNAAEIGIELRNMAEATITNNVITGTGHNSVQATAVNAGANVTITGNTFENWGTATNAQSQLEGRAVRVSGGANVVVNNNKMINANAPESFVKITKVTGQTAQAIDVDKNYWNGNNPLPLFETDGTNDPVSYIKGYYSDANLTNYIPLTASVAMIGTTYYQSFEAALNAVQDGETITLLGTTGSEISKEIEFTRAITFTITGTAPNYALPVVTFQNATVNISNAEILIPELDARQNAIINVIDSKVYDAGGNSIAKSYYNGAINISGTSEVYMMQVTTMGYINISGTAKLHATWQTNVYGNGLVTISGTSEFNTAALHLTGQDYNGRDNTDADRVGKPAEIIVDGANFTVGKVYSSNGADYSYNSSHGINIGTIDGKFAILNVKNGGKVNYHMADGETANVGAGGTVNVNASTFKTQCRDTNGTVTLANNGTFNITGAAILAANVTGDGWFYMNSVAMTEATNLNGAKVRFASGTNNIVGSTIDNGFFQVGIGAYNGQDEKVDTVNGVVVNVTNNAKIGAKDEPYAGWLGTGFYDTDAEKLAAMTDAKYVLNIENSIAEFGYIHVSNDGELNVSGNATVKAWYNNSDYSFYAGDLIINGTAKFDATDVLAIYTKVSCDNGTDNPGTLNINAYTEYEAERHNGAISGTNFDIRKTGVVNVAANANLHIGEYTSIAADAKMNIAGETTALGTITNNGAITLTTEAAKLTTPELTTNVPTTNVPEYKVVYENGTYIVVAKVYVAEVNGVKYESLQEAFNAGGDIKVIRNFTLPAIANVAADKVVTLDLNGFTISYSSDVAGDAMITNRGNLTITDNTTDKSGKIIYTYTGTPDTNYSKGNYTISNSGILTLNAGTVENATAVMSHANYAIDNNSNNYEAILTINGGNVINTYNYAVRQIANKKNILNVNDGKIEGTRAVWIQLPGSNTAVAPEVELNVTGGTLTSIDGGGVYKLAVYSYSYGNDMANVKLNISGGTFNGDIALTGGNNKTNVETLNISGGTFYGKYGEVYSYGDDAKAIQAITIKGGVFATNGAEMYAEDNGYIFVLNADGMYAAQQGAYEAQVVKQDNTIVKYTVLNDALAAAQAGETVEIFAGTFTQDLNINKDITVVGERDDNNNNLVTFNGKLNITADGATAKNLNVNNGSSTAGYISAKNVLVEGCDVTGGNGFRYCYTTGTVTFKDSKITGATYGIHFDGYEGGNIVIENCDITGWTSFAGAITNVAITGTNFLNGNYNQLRFYQNAQMTDCTFNPNMTIDFGKDDVDAAFTDCSVTDGSPLSDVIYLGDIAEMGVDVTINQIPLIVEARVADDVDGNDADYYLTLEEAMVNVADNQFVKLYAAVAAEPMTITVSMTLDLNGFTITGTPTNSAAYAVITNRGNLTITDNTTEKLGKIICDHQLAGSTAYAVNTIVNSGTLTIEAGTIENKSTSSNQIGYAIDNNSTSYNSVVVIKGGKVTVSGTSSYYDGIRQFCNSMTTENSVTIAGGEVSSLWMQNPSDGTTRNANDVKGSFLIEGGRLTNLWIEPSASFTGSIIGGHVGNVGRFDENNTNDLENRRLTEFITGGTFGMDVNEYCHEHYDAVTTDNIIWTVEQVIFVMETALANGWNWFSAYVDIDGADGLASIKESLGTNGLMVKDGETGKYIQYTASAGTWNGTLTETSSVGMYMIKTSDTIDEFIVEGSAKLDPSDEEMTMAISKGWNYIPYPLDEAQSITTALGFTPQHGDVIKRKAGGDAIYQVGQGGQGWRNAFDMEPGQGYMYKSNATSTITFNYSYPTGGAKSSMLANVETIDYHWTVDAHKYANTMNMIAMVNVDGEMVKGGYEVAAFSNEGECRGTARPFYVEDMDAYLMILTIHGEEVENLTFRYYDIDTDTEYELNNVVTYSDNAIVGTIDNPYIFTMNILGIGENSIDNINIYPNPTTTDREINLNATFDKVEVYNALGVKVVEYQNVDTIDALETAGIYVIRVTDNNGDVKHCRLVVK